MKYPLIRTFTLFSIIAFILTGLVLSQIISGHIRDSKMVNLEEATRFTVKSVVRSDLDISDFESAISSAKEERIKSDIYDSLDLYGIKSITMLNMKKEIIISGDSNYILKQTDTNLDRVMMEGKPFAISDTYKLNDEGGDGRELFFNIYEPIILDGKIEGVFIFQIPDQSISSHVNMVVQAIVLTLSGGLFILFVLLIGVLYNASKMLFTQNKELAIQKAEIEKSYIRLDASYRNTIVALSNAVDARDPYTAGHSSRVTKISQLIAKELSMAKDDEKILEYAALFHDIGKLGIPDHILHKEGKLTDDEYEIIKKHPDIGVSILEKVDFLAEALPIIRHHHERFCGNGYPSGIRGGEIPLGARIIAIADTYDAMTTDRPYRKAFDHNAAVREILKNKGTQFDDSLVDMFVRIENNAKIIT